jgi:hypothetical protein
MGTIGEVPIEADVTLRRVQQAKLFGTPGNSKPCGVSHEVYFGPRLVREENGEKIVYPLDDGAETPTAVIQGNEQVCYRAKDTGAGC